MAENCCRGFTTFCCPWALGHSSFEIRIKVPLIQNSVLYKNIYKHIYIYIYILYEYNYINITNRT